MTSIRSFDLHTTNYIYKAEKVANIAFYDVRNITSQVTIVFTRKFMQLIERESGNWKLEMVHVEKMKKAKHLEGKLANS